MSDDDTAVSCEQPLSNDVGFETFHVCKYQNVLILLNNKVLMYSLNLLSRAALSFSILCVTNKDVSFQPNFCVLYIF